MHMYWLDDVPLELKVHCYIFIFNRKNVVVYNAVMHLRTALDELIDNVKGLTSDEKGMNFIQYRHLVFTSLCDYNFRS